MGKSQQKNKPHKAGRHASKSERRTHRASTGGGGGGGGGRRGSHSNPRAGAVSGSKQRRLQAMKQIRNERKSQILAQKRGRFANRMQPEASDDFPPPFPPPVLLGLFPLGGGVSHEQLDALREHLLEQQQQLVSKTLTYQRPESLNRIGQSTSFSPTHKYSLQVIVAQEGDLDGALDLAAVCDVIAFVVGVDGSCVSDSATTATSHFDYDDYDDDDDDDDEDMGMGVGVRLAAGRSPSLSGLSSIRGRSSAPDAMMDSVSLASTTKSKSIKASRMKALIRSVMWGGGRRRRAARRKKEGQGLRQVDLEEESTLRFRKTKEAEIIQALNAQGMPLKIALAMGLDELPPSQLPMIKKRVAERVAGRLARPYRSGATGNNANDNLGDEGEESDDPLNNKKGKTRSTSSSGASSADDLKLFGIGVDNDADVKTLMRRLSEWRIESFMPSWRTSRPLIVCEGARVLPTRSADQDASDRSDSCTLEVCGFVRQTHLSAGQIAYLSGIGDYEIAYITRHLRIEAEARGRGGDSDLDSSFGHETFISPPDDESMADDGAPLSSLTVRRCDLLDEGAQKEPLVRENVVDWMTQEQTWPTEEELRRADEASAAARSLSDTADGKRRRRRLPEGTSEYQASWIIESDEEDDGDEEEEDEEDHAGGEEEGDDDNVDMTLTHDNNGHGSLLGAMDDYDDEEDDDEDVGGGDGDDDNNDDEEIKVRKYKHAQELATRRAEAERGEVDFPDEVDTPASTPARDRFIKYRGLKSFRSTPWDPKENLPLDYGRIFALSNFRNIAKQAKAHHRGRKERVFAAGSYVIIGLKDIPAELAQAFVRRVYGDASQQAVTSIATLTGLLRHETKMTVVNAAILRNIAFKEPLKARDPVRIRMGFRSLDLPGGALYSHDNFSSDKYKYLRFLLFGSPSVASFFAPITFGPMPVLIFGKVLAPEQQQQQDESKDKDMNGTTGEEYRLAATGSLKSCDPDRIVLKRVVLSGYPYRVNKHRAVIRMMFFNPEDVKWFKPLELWTKHGRRGRILDSVGTHGLFKAVFDGVVQQHDTICVSLYKRVFPKWNGESKTDAES